MASGANDIKIQPVNVLWRIPASETIDFDGVSASDFGGTSFTIYSAADAIQYYVWGDENTTDADPTETGTGVEVDYGAAATSTVIATAVAAALDALGGFTSTSSGTVVSVYRTADGEVTSTVDIDSTVTITQCRQGKDVDLGLLQGDISLEVSPATFTVQAHQTGLTPRGSLFQGFEALTATTTLLETETSDLKNFYNLYGATWTPSAGTEISSMGTSKQGVNLLVDGARLVFKPVNAANNLDNTSLSLAVPVPSSLNFSGENPRTLEVTWQGYVDDQLDSRASAFILGDETQAGIRT